MPPPMRGLPSRKAPTWTPPRPRSAPACAGACSSCRSAVRSRRPGSAHGRPTAPAAAARPRRFPGSPAATGPARRRSATPARPRRPSGAAARHGPARCGPAPLFPCWTDRRRREPRPGVPSVGVGLIALLEGAEPPSGTVADDELIAGALLEEQPPPAVLVADGDVAVLIHFRRTFPSPVPVA